MLELSKKQKRVATSVLLATAIVGGGFGLATVLAEIFIQAPWLLYIIAVCPLSILIYGSLEEEDTKNRNNGECPN